MTVVSALAVPTGREQLVLDPAEVAVSRTELDIHSGSILVRQEGPDWGDIEITPYMAQAERGEIPVDFRIPNRKVTIPLMLNDFGGTTFYQARLNLQTKVGLLQREGGWLRRTTIDGGSIYLDIVNATLGFGGSTHQALHSLDPDVDLVLETLPDWYGDGIELTEHSETTEPELIFTEAGIEGDHTGRVRIVVTEESGNSQSGLLWGIRSRHYDDALTAALAYGAEDLTPLDTATVVTLSGSSGGASNNAVRHSSLSTSWTPVLSTDDASEGALTHTGTYRVWARVYSTSGDDVQLRLLWDVGDLALPVENAPVRLPPTASQFYDLDLGEIRLDQSPVGAHRWQGVIQGKGDAGGENVSIDKLWLVPVDEGYGVLRAPVSTVQGLADFSARDEFNQSSGALAGKTASGGGVWSGAGDSDDFFVVAGEVVSLQRATTSDTDVRVDVLGSAATNSCVQVDMMSSGFGVVGVGDGADIIGAAARYIDQSNYLAAYIRATSAETAIVVQKRVAGVNADLAKYGLVYTGGSGGDTITVDTRYTLRLLVDTSGRFFLWWWRVGGAAGAPLLTGYDSALATGGALASGKAGLADYNSGVAGQTRSYDNFAAWVPTLDAVLHPNQSAELRYDGHVREDSAGAAYGPVSHVIGDLPRLPPSGMEGRTTEVFLKASRGDFDQLPDSGIDDQSAQLFYSPSWLFVASV